MLIVLTKGANPRGPRTMLDSASHKTAFDGPAQGPACDHAVQFYDDPAFLHQTVTDFLSEGIAQDEPVIVIATQANRDAFDARLRTAGIDVDRLAAAGTLREFDAKEMLATFMSSGKPDARLFRRSIGAVIDGARTGRPGAGIRAYGEMVDLLWRDGLPDAAITVEGLWNSLALTHRFTLLCGYAMGHFYKEAHAAPFHDICASHTHVRPAERYAPAPDGESRGREIAILQQRARALEAEIVHRRQLELALREALEARNGAEAERERLLAMERAARAEAESAARVKDDFLAVLSHELRTPLNAILGWAHLANQPGADGPTTRRALEVIERNAAVQLHVTDDLLDLSRILTGKLRMKPQIIDASAALQAALESVRPAADAKGIEVTVTDTAGGMPVIGDRDRLQQVFWNLLSNAIKFTPEHGSVAVRQEVLNSQARIVIADTGEGIAPAFLPCVFERFRQADNGTTRTHGGLGLGLALVRYLVEAHGGSVSVASAGVGCGSTFTVTLPVATS